LSKTYPSAHDRICDCLCGIAQVCRPGIENSSSVVVGGVFFTIVALVFRLIPLLAVWLPWEISIPDREPRNARLLLRSQILQHIE
jgi:hypothetical protein